MPGTHGQHDATTDPAVIDRMWRDATFANVGINCEASGLYVVDVDMNEALDKQGRATWTALMAEHGHVETYTVQTWSGGLHFYYLMPPGVTLTNTAGKAGGRGLGRDIDTRGNGYVVAPPSVVSEDGVVGQYTVLKDLPFAPLPQWIIDMVTAAPRPPRALSSAPAPEPQVMERMAVLVEELASAPEGEGNATAARVAFMAGQYVGAGQIDADLTVSLLCEALVGWTWRSKHHAMSMKSTISRQVAAGYASPRPWERAVASNGHAPVLPTAEATMEAPVTVQTVEETPMVPIAVDPNPKAAADPESEVDRPQSMWSTDNGQGLFLRDKIGRMIFVVGVGWFVWDKKRWAPVDEAVIEARVARFYRRQFEKMLDRYKDDQQDKYLALAKAYKQFMSTGRLKSIVGHLRLTDGVQVAQAALLDSHHHLLNCQNGVVDLRTGTLSAHDPELLITQITKGEYRPGYTHPDWDKALTSLPTTEEMDYLQLRMGQALTGDTAKDVTFMIGGGSNAKSLFTTDGLVHAIGDYAHNAQRSLISKGNGREGAATPDRALLRGKRFVWIEELPEAHALSIEEIKSLADTGMISARLLNANPTTYQATHTLFVTSNSTPSVSETDFGTWRRLLRISFPFKYTENPQGPMDRPIDFGLKDRIKGGRGGQHEAILAWLVAGAVRYYADKASIGVTRRPASIKEDTMEWQTRADRVLGYIADRIVAEPTGVIARQDLYADFVAWLTAQGHAKWSMETFMNRFRDHESLQSAGVLEARTRDHDSISRPLPAGVSFSSALGPLPSQVRVLRGLTFAAS
jgi:P4 family phage/plasmid primase-like protien